jgi:hypothetical protein
MNSIKLTKEHKDKLLKMCKILFVEYEFEFITAEDEDGYLIYDHFIFYLKKDYENCESEKSRQNIHWFKFIMFNLIHKLNYHTISVNNSKIIEWNDLQNAKHPVDYLY